MSKPYAEQWKDANTIYLQTVQRLRMEAGDKDRTVYAVSDVNIVRCLKELDRLNKGFDNARLPDKESLYAQKSQLAAGFKKHADDLNREAVKFIEETQKQITLWKQVRAKGQPAANRDDAKLKIISENWVRGLKVLKTSVDAVAKTAEARAEVQDSQLMGMKTQLNTYENMAREYLAVLKAAVARGLAAAQRIKANPTAAAYNKEFPKAARDITQQLGNVKKLEDNHVAPPGLNGAAARQLFDRLFPWATDSGKMKSVQLTVSPGQILRQVSDFNQAVKAVKEAYRI